MYLGTLFLRNRPELELMRRIVHEEASGTTVRLAVLGCSIGVEVYSILWALRSDRPDLKIVVHAVDISREVLDVAARGVYSTDVSAMVHSSIFEGLSDTERAEIFDWEGDRGRVKSWLREGIRWEVGDAGDPELPGVLGTHDVVVANNFLCHMDARSAESCLRNLVRFVRPGGYLFVTGVDLDVRTRVALDLAWVPVSDLRAEIHDGDPLVCGDWPWEWWGLEPFDASRPDWETRYAAVFRIDGRAVATSKRPDGGVVG
jgi:SAM-dependent methyltransferase